MSLKGIEQTAILCGGLGTRLQPLTHDIPKSMIPMGDRPFLETLVRWFRGQGISRFVLCSGHLHEHIVEHFLDGSSLGVEIVHSVEDEPLGTGGALLNAMELLDGQFFMAFGDSLSTINLEPMVRLFHANDALAVITAYDNHERVAGYNVQVSGDGEVLAYDKKNQNDNMNGVEAGLSLLDRSILELAGARKFSLEMDIFPK